MENFRERRINTGLSQQEFAESIGVHYRTIQNWEKGRAIPESKLEFVEKFLAMHTPERNNIVREPESTYDKPVTPKDGAKPPVPYYNVDFAGGWNSEELFSLARPDFYINNPEFERSEFACNLVGNSISRRIPNKSIIGLKQIHNWETYFPTNELYAVVMKNDLRTVKIVKRSKDKNLLILVPDPLPEFNQTEYEPEEVPIDFISRFYQVVAWAQLERIAQ